MKKFLLLLLLPVVVATAQSTSGFHRVSQVITRGNSGVTAQVVPSARVFVQNTNTGLAATIYSDPNLTFTIPGAIVTADSVGNYDYYAPLNTCYTENISSPSQGSKVIPNVCGNSGLSLPLGTLNGGTGTTTAPLDTQLLIGQIGSVYAPKTVIGDCTLADTGTLTCLKTNGTPFTAAATTALGTSGASLCLLSSACTYSQNLTLSGTSTLGTTLTVSNTTGKIWQLVSRGSTASDPSHFDVVDSTDSVTALSFTNSAITTALPISIAGSLVCTATNGVCAVGSGSVTNFIASSGSWPTWLVPSVATSTTTPTLSVAASAIPNSALANASITVNGTTCTLGSSCSVTGTSRTCNANGCYTIASDGTISEWGTLFCGSTSCAVVYPFPFTTTANLSVTATVNYSATNVTTLIDSVTTTGFNAKSGGVVFVGGGGSSYTGGGTYSWQAMGN